MTGSGSSTGACELGRVTVEFRSVNGKGLTIRYRMAPECLGLETAIEKRIRDRFKRGTVQVAIDVVEPVRRVEQSVDAEAFAAAAKRLRELSAATGVEGPELRDVLSIPGVVSSASSDRSRTSWEPSEELAALFDDALDRLVEHRVEEGAETLGAMHDHLGELATELASVQERVPEIVTEHRANLLARVNEFLDQHATQLEPEHVIREVALFADKVDVAEEMQRLAAHIARTREKMSGGGPVGRDVEFLLQEILREVNTLGSKSPDVRVAHSVVAMKSSVDKLKEQAANLE